MNWGTFHGDIYKRKCTLLSPLKVGKNFTTEKNGATDLKTFNPQTSVHLLFSFKQDPVCSCFLRPQWTGPVKYVMRRKYILIYAPQYVVIFLIMIFM